MNNIILPVNRDFEKAQEFIKSIKRKDCVFIVGTTKEGEQFFKNSKYVKVYVFKAKSKKEEMINSLAEYVQDGKIIVLRKLISAAELNEFIASTTDITVCATKKLNKFCQFFYNIWQKIIKLLFDFSFFEGDVSVVALGENAAMVAKNITNLSYATRINRWKGLSQSAVSVASKPAKKEYDKVKVNAMLIGWIALFLAVIASTAVYFVFAEASFLAGFLWACALLLSLLSVVIAINIYLLNVKTGKRLFKKAEREE